MLMYRNILKDFLENEKKYVDLQYKEINDITY